MTNPLLGELKALNDFLLSNIDDADSYISKGEEDYMEVDLVVTVKNLKLLQIAISSWIYDIKEEEKSENEKKKSIDDYIITKEDIENLKKDFKSFEEEHDQKILFIKREFFKWMDDKNSNQNETINDFKISLIGRDIRSGTDQ